jgi:hypothetical protein
MKVPFNKLKVGDFFTVNIDLGTENNTFLYQKIKDPSNNYNAVLINNGELSQLYISADSNQTFEQVEVEYTIKSL